MTPRSARALVAYAALWAPLATARSQSAPPGALAAAGLDTAALEQSLLAELRESHTPGAAIAVVRGDSVVYAKGFGVASVESGEPVTPATLFRIGSTTKMFTGFTAALLAREGKLSLG